MTRLLGLTVLGCILLTFFMIKVLLEATTGGDLKECCKASRDLWSMIWKG